MVEENLNNEGNAQGSGPEGQPEPQPDFYEEFKEKGQIHPVYKNALKPSPKKRDMGLLQKLAPIIIPEKLDIERAGLSQSNDSELLSKFVTLGYERNKNELITIGDANLKTILKKVPEQNLEYMLREVELKDSSNVSLYNETIPIHKDYQTMWKNLINSKRDDINAEEKNEALANIKNRVISFYESECNDREVLDLLKDLAEISDIKLTRYQMFIKDKRNEFDNKIGKDNLDSYLKSSAADKADCYSLLAAELRSQRG